MSSIPNILAGRYASPEMVHLWSPGHKVTLERRLWLSVLRAQAALGVSIPEGVPSPTRPWSTRWTSTPSPPASGSPATM